jgi:outer membrane receptor protein involved in Fe transport
VTHNQHIIGNNADLTWDSRFFGMDNRFAAQLQASSNWITFEQEGNPNSFPDDTVSVIDPSPGVYGPEFPNTRNSRLTDIAGSFEDRLKITPVFALIGGVRLEQLTLNRFGVNFDGTIPDGQPFTKTSKPVSYRAAYTYEPIPGLTFYSMYATAARVRTGRHSLHPAWGRRDRLRLRNRREACRCQHNAGAERSIEMHHGLTPDHCAATFSTSDSTQTLSKNSFFGP